MQYLIHACLLLSACFAYYWLMLRGETHFQLNRYVLLACLTGSLALPLITVPATWSFQQAIAMEEATIPVKNSLAGKAVVSAKADAPTADHVDIAGKAEVKKEDKAGSKANAKIESSAGAAVQAATDTPPAAPIDWWRILRWVYLAGVIVFGFNFLVQLGQLLVRMIRNPGHDLGDFRLVEMREDEAPYSFWNRIFLNPDRYDPDTFHQIVQHEQIHVDQKHSIDLLLAELVIIFQWFNPFAWLYRSAIEHNLEFLTDAEMLRIGNDPESYQLSLVKVAIPNFPNGLVASYNQSFLEKRITMMKTRKSSVRSGWKYFTILPLLLLSVLQFNAVAQSPVPPARPAPIASPQPATTPSVAPAQAARPHVIVTPGPSVNAQANNSNSVSVNQSVSVNSSNYQEGGVTVQVASPNVVISGNPMPVATPMIEMPEGMENIFKSWTALIDGDEVCFQFSARNNAYDNNWNWSSSRCFSKLSLGTLPKNSMGEFSLSRASGKMNFKGVFDGNDGAGSFDFEPNSSFTSMLKREGFGTYEERELLLFFMADMNDDYIAYLKSQGYDPSHQKLLELAIFYDDLDEVKSRISGLKRMGYGKPSLQKLVELQIHGVSEEYAQELSKSGFDDLSLQDLIEGRIHGLSADFMKGMAGAGFTGMNFDRAKEMAIHGISPEYVEEMAALGYKGMGAKDIINAKIHGVNARKIADLRDAGLTNLTLKQAKDLSIHGVDAEFVAALAKFGFTGLSPEQVTNAKIHGLNSRRLAELKSTGLPITDLDEVKNAMIHGVDAEFISGLRAIGYKDLTMKDFVKARIHGVTPEWAASFREVGFKDIPLSTLINLRIHGVSPSFIKDRLKDGRTLKDYVKMKIHGL